jgi:hypothetical protein
MDCSIPNLGFATAVGLQIALVAAMWYLPWRFDVETLRDGREWLSALVFGFMAAQTSLVGLWSALGAARLPLRALTSLLALAAIYIASYSFYIRTDPQWSFDLAVLLAYCILLAWGQVVCGALWLTWGAQLRLGNPLRETAEQPVAQFHLWHILAVVTGAGVLLAAARGLIRTINADLPFDAPAIWLWFGLILLVHTTFAVVTALLAAAAAMSSIWPVRATVAGLIVVAFYSIFLERPIATLVEGPSASAEYYIVTNLVAFAWTSLAMNLVRLDGWRWEDAKPNPNPTRQRGG